MFRALRDSERHSMLYLSLMLCCGSLSLLALTAQSSMDALAEGSSAGVTVAMPATPEKLRFPQISVARDPFVPDRLAEPSLQSGAVPPALSAGPIVRAVVLGAQSRALIEFNGNVRVLGAGDALGTARIASVDSRGVVLDNGTRVALEEHQP